MYVMVEENKNCAADERVFADSGAKRIVERIEIDSLDGKKTWYEVMGMDENGGFIPAQAVRVDDSGAGSAWLIYGGLWGLRLRAVGSNEPWDINNVHQRGIPFAVLDIAGEAIVFKN
jgi:hypothetical protein